MAPPAKDPYEELSEEASTDPYAAFGEPEQQAVAPDSIPQRLAEYAGIINRAAAPYAVASTIPLVGPAALAATDVVANLYNLGAQTLGGRPIMTGSEVIQANLPEMLFPYREPRTKEQRLLSSVVEAGIGAKATANALRELSAMTRPGTTQNILAELGRNQAGQVGAAVGATGVPQVAQEYFDVTSPAELFALGIIGGAGGGLTAQRVTQKRPPSTEQFRASASRAYDEVKQAGIVFAPQSYDNLVTRINQKLSDEAYNPRAESPMKNVVAALAEKKGKPLDYKDFEKLRIIAQDAAQSDDASTRRLSKIVVKELDDYVYGAKSQDIVSGNLPQMQLAIRKARSDYAAAMRGSTIEKAVERAKLTGGNVEDYQREFRALFNDEDAMRQFSSEQKAAIKKTAQVGGYIDILDSIGAVSPISRVKGALPVNVGALATSYAIDPTSTSMYSPQNLMKFGAITTASNLAARGLISRRARIAGDIARGGFMRDQLSPTQLAIPVGTSILERQAAPINFLAEQQRLAEQGF